MVSPEHMATDNTFVNDEDKPTPEINTALFVPLICPMNAMLTSPQTIAHNCCKEINHDRESNWIISDAIGLVPISSNDGKDGIPSGVCVVDLDDTNCACSDTWTLPYAGRIISLPGREDELGPNRKTVSTLRGDFGTSLEDMVYIN
eukprot:168900_1